MRKRCIVPRRARRSAGSRGVAQPHARARTRRARQRARHLLPLTGLLLLGSCGNLCRTTWERRRACSLLSCCSPRHGHGSAVRHRRTLRLTMQEPSSDGCAPLAGIADCTRATASQRCDYGAPKAWRARRRVRRACAALQRQQTRGHSESQTRKRHSLPRVSLRLLRSLRPLRRSCRGVAAGCAARHAPCLRCQARRKAAGEARRLPGLATSPP